MSIYGLLAFAIVYAIAVAVPGPGVAAVVARSLAHGTRGAPAFIAGFIVGDLIWFAIAAGGLAALAETARALFTALKYVGAAYLLYLAYELWIAPTQHAANISKSSESSARLFLGSVTLTLANPKTILFFLALLPTVVQLDQLTALGWAEIGLVIVVVLPLVLGSYVLLAARARQLFKSSRAIRRINRGSSAAMACAAVAVATR